MVKQRFLTHFKPWLIAVCKVGALIVRINFSIRSARGFNIRLSTSSDVVTAATIALFALALALCMLGMGRVVLVQNAQASWVVERLKLAFANQRDQRTLGTSRP